MGMLGLILFGCGVVWVVFGGNNRRYPPYNNYYNQPYYPQHQYYDDQRWQMYPDGKRREVNPMSATLVFVAALVVGLIVLSKFH